MSLILLGVGSTVVAGSLSESSSTNGNGGNTDVGIWYVTYNTSNHWTHFGEVANPIMYRPLIKNPDGIVGNEDDVYGTPNSYLEDEIDMHLQMLSDARIDFVLFDLTNGGLTDGVSYGYPGNQWIVQTAQKTCERIANWNKTHSWKIRYAVAIGCYDDICGIDNSKQKYYVRSDKEQATEKYRDIRGPVIEKQAQAVYETFVTNAAYGDAYYQVDNKPLLVIHNWGWDDTQAWEKYTGDKTYGNKFTVEGSSEESGTYTNPTNGVGTFQWRVAKGTQVSTKVETVMPGWGRSTTSDYPRDNGNLYDKNCNIVLNNELPRIVLITSFNDFHEQTAVMPTDTTQCDTSYEEQWNSPAMYWQKTIDFIQSIRTRNGDYQATVDAKISSIKGNKEEALLPASRLIDGKTAASGDATQLCGVTYADPASKLAWYEVTLEKPAMINRINLYLYEWEAQKRPKDLAVDVYTSQGTWVRVTELHKLDWNIKANAEGNNYRSDHNVLTLNFKDVEALAFRVTANFARVQAGNFRLVEMKAIYDPYLSPVTYTGVTNATYDIYSIPEVSNVLIKSVTANAALSDYPVSRLTDGIVDARSGIAKHSITAYDANSKLAWFESKLSSEREINQVKLFLYEWVANERPKDLAVDVCLSSGGWKRVAELHNIDWKIAPNSENTNWRSDTNEVTINFDSVEAVAFRVTANFARVESNISNFRLVEIKAYSNPYLTAADNTGVTQPESETYAIAGLPEGTAYVECFSDISPYRGSTMTAPEGLTGYLFAGWYKDEACKEAISETTSGDAAYAKFVHEKVLTIKTQITAGTTAKSKKSDLRFVTSVDSLCYRKIGFKIVCNGITKEYSSDYVYNKLTAVGASGEVLELEPWNEFSKCSRYFKACTITGIANKYFARQWTVTPFWVTEDGTRVDGRTSVVTVASGINGLYEDEDPGSGTEDNGM